MNNRTTKIYINTRDTEVGSTTQRAATISGYMNVTLTDEYDPTISVVKKYHINTTRPKDEKLGHWRAGFLGRLASYKSYYKSEFENVKVKTGNIVEDRGLVGDGNGGKKRIKKTVACWIAAYDEKVLAFEVHYPTGAIFRTTDVVVNTNDLGQRETDFLDCEIATDETINTFVVMAERKQSTRRKRSDSKLSIQDEETMLQMMKQKYKQKDIAAHFGITQPMVSKMKKHFKQQGQL
ncbi:hypothetical protein MUC14_002778 [Vibrio parahaemolyticus]|nr:hypothetical protein [Vibrio parahaemolyticus]